MRSSAWRQRGLLPSQTILNMTSVLKSHVELLEQRSMRFSQFSYLAWAKKKKKKHWYLFKHPTNCCFIIHDSKYRQNYFTSNNHRSFKKNERGYLHVFPRISSCLCFTSDNMQKCHVLPRMRTFTTFRGYVNAASEGQHKVLTVNKLRSRSGSCLLR